MFDALHDLWTALLAIPHIGLYLTIGWALYLLWLGGWIVLQKREPAATLSWLMGLALLPYLGFLIYHWLGPQRVLVGHAACSCGGRGGHTTWTCRECDDVTYGPTLAAACTIRTGPDER